MGMPETPFCNERSLLEETTPGAGMELRAALLTTYEAPDPESLLREFLPHWLGVGRRPDASDSSSHNYHLFRLELDRAHGGRTQFLCQRPGNASGGGFRNRAICVGLLTIGERKDDGHFVVFEDNSFDLIFFVVECLVYGLARAIAFIVDGEGRFALLVLSLIHI